MSDGVEAVVYAVDNGANIINCSWGIGMPKKASSLMKEAIKYANDKGVLVVGAAGNESDDVGDENFGYEPASISEVMAVASVERDKSLSWFSNYGKKVEVAAPGGDFILSLLSSKASLLYDEYGRVVDKMYIRFRGTSMAAPYVSGLAALVKANFADLTMDEVRKRVRGAVVGQAIGLDREYIGSGIINAGKALKDLNPGKIVVDNIDFGATIDRNGRLDPGESVRLSLEIVNYWDRVDNLKIWISSEDGDFEIKDKKVEINIFNGGEKKLLSREFPVKVKESAEISKVGVFDINFKYYIGGKKFVDKVSFEEMIGLRPVEKLQIFSGESSVELSWEPSKEEGVAGYSIYRRKEGEGEFVRVNEGVVGHPKFRYVDKGLNKDTIYHYMVKVVGVNGKESEGGEEVEIKTRGGSLKFLTQKILSDFSFSETNILWTGYDKNDNLWLATYVIDLDYDKQIGVFKNGEFIKSSVNPFPMPFYKYGGYFAVNFIEDLGFDRDGNLLVGHYIISSEEGKADYVELHRFSIIEDEPVGKKLLEFKLNREGGVLPKEMKIADYGGGSYYFMFLFDKVIEFYKYEDGSLIKESDYDFSKISNVKHVSNLKWVVGEDGKIEVIGVYEVEGSRYKKIFHLSKDKASSIWDFDVIESTQCFNGLDFVKEGDSLYIVFSGNCYALSYKKYSDGEWGETVHFWEAEPYFFEDGVRQVQVKGGKILGGILRADYWWSARGYLNTLSVVEVDTNKNMFIQPIDLAFQLDDFSKIRDLDEGVSLEIHGVAVGEKEMAVFWHFRTIGEQIIMTTFAIE